MLTRSSGCSRRRTESGSDGFTVAELVVALAVGAVALAGFAISVAHQERVHHELSRRVRARAQLREGLASLIGELRAASPGAGDFAAGAVHDSAVELRTTIGTAVVCVIAGRSVSGALASFVTPPESGDTAWAYVASDTSAAWIPLEVAGAEPVPASGAPTCPFAATAATVVGGAGMRRAWYRLELSNLPPGVSMGAPLRVTRPVRYSLYRSPAESGWYLGRREWSRARGRFETIQPVSGPFRKYAPESDQTSGLALRYNDRQGAAITSTSATDSIAAITVVLRAPPPDTRVVDRRDAIAVTVALRNPP